MTFRCPVCYYLKTHFDGRLCVSCAQLFEVKQDGKVQRKKSDKEPKQVKKAKE